MVLQVGKISSEKMLRCLTSMASSPGGLTKPEKRGRLRGRHDAHHFSASMWEELYIRLLFLQKSLPQWGLQFWPPQVLLVLAFSLPQVMLYTKPSHRSTQLTQNGLDVVLCYSVLPQLQLLSALTFEATGAKPNRRRHRRSLFVGFVGPRSGKSLMRHTSPATKSVLRRNGRSEFSVLGGLKLFAEEQRKHLHLGRLIVLRSFRRAAEKQDVDSSVLLFWKQNKVSGSQ